MQEYKLKQWNRSRIYVKKILTLTLEEKQNNPNVWKYDNVGDKREVDCEGFIQKDDDGKFYIKFVKNESIKQLYQSIIDNKIIECFRNNRKPIEINDCKIICGYVEWI